MAGALMVVMGFRDLFNYSVFFFSPEFLATDLSERASDVRLSGQSGPLPTSVPCLRQRLFAAAKAEGPHRSRTRRQRFRTLRYVVQTRKERDGGGPFSDSLTAPVPSHILSCVPVTWK